jgi:hypothetical protein
MDDPGQSTENHDIQQPSGIAAMARPGLEPGTPRFSGLGAKVSNKAKSLLRS